ncbi:MAG: cytochrome c3 family protein [Candidatus Zixiibacteriota bacterium]
MPQQVKAAGYRAHGLAVFTCLGVLVVLCGWLAADNGHYRTSPHGSTQDGVLRLIDLPRGSCAQCHYTHALDNAQPFGLFTSNSNELCFAVSAGGCHADQPTGASAGYPAQESDRMPIGSSDPGYFEFNSGGVRIPGIQNLVRWPGQTIWEDPIYSTHYADQDMPIKDFFGNGSCENCHNVHGSAAPHDMLDTTYRGITGSETGLLPENYALCLSCHTIDGPPGMGEPARSIAYFYDRSINPGSSSGHGISTGGGYVPSGARLPCYDCHNPHGSAGYGNLGGNRFLLSDQRSGWYGLTDIRNDNDQVRRFCFGCHPPADSTSVEPVEGLTLSPLPSTVSAHQSGASTHCYDCHGRDYTSPTSNNVHNPAPGGDCLICHSTAQGPRRAVVNEFGLNAHHVFVIGQVGSLTTNDCGVCHMEGDASTGDITGQYHANGFIDLRNPDNGLPLTGFVSLTRDTTSSVLESWVVEVQNDFCLKCHDGDGALSADAWVPGGSPLYPFSDPYAEVIDVYNSFDPTNAAYHPVRAPGNNPYTVPSPENNFTVTMLPPFNQTATHDLISCFDCHETSGHGSNNSGMLRTETYFREPSPHPSFEDGQRAFCTRCHNEQYYIFDTRNASRFDKHDKRPHIGQGGGNINRHSCRGCHAGIYDVDQDAGCDNGAGIGNIHGYTFTYQSCSPTAGVTPKSFLFGGYLKGWKVVDSQKNKCYANCHHSNGKEY